MFLRKSPHSLPPEQYGGGRKRIFIGLMLASCVLLCLVLCFFLILPWSGLGAGLHWLPLLSMTMGVLGIAVLAWMCLTLIFHI